MSIERTANMTEFIPGFVALDAIRPHGTLIGGVALRRLH